MILRKPFPQPSDSASPFILAPALHRPFVKATVVGAIGAGALEKAASLCNDPNYRKDIFALMVTLPEQGRKILRLTANTAFDFVVSEAGLTVTATRDNVAHNFQVQNIFYKGGSALQIHDNKTINPISTQEVIALISKTDELPDTYFIAPEKAASPVANDLFIRIVEQRDKAALDEYVEKNYVYHIRLAKKFLFPQTELAGEAVSTAYIRALSRLDRREGKKDSFCRNPDSFSSWFHEIIKNSAFKLKTSSLSGAKGNRSFVELDEDFGNGAADPTFDKVSEKQEKALLVRMRSLMQGFYISYAEDGRRGNKKEGRCLALAACYLHYVEELPLADIADRMGQIEGKEISLNTIKTRLFYGRKDLQSHALERSEKGLGMSVQPA